MLDRRTFLISTLAAATFADANAQDITSMETIAAALADPNRNDTDRLFDQIRHPTEVLAFTGVRTGQHVADLGPGLGYYTRLFSAIVGPEGHVLAVTDAPSPPPRQNRPPIYEMEANPAYRNVDILSEGWAFRRREPLDFIFVSQIYHDFHVTALHVNTPQMNRLLFRALKPGGALVVIDHAAPAAADQLRIPDQLHRIDPSIVREELEAAGFVFEAESDALRNPNDPRTAPVFDPSIRYRTDQFMLRFRKPAE